MRKRYGVRRSSAMSDQLPKFDEGMSNNNLSSNSLQSNTESNSNKRQPKRDSRHTLSDDEPTTDWTPEIPFWNVSIALNSNS